MSSSSSLPTSSQTNSSSSKMPLTPSSSSGAPGLFDVSVSTQQQQHTSQLPSPFTTGTKSLSQSGSFHPKSVTGKKKCQSRKHSHTATHFSSSSATAPNGANNHTVNGTHGVPWSTSMGSTNSAHSHFPLPSELAAHYYSLNQQLIAAQQQQQQQQQQQHPSSRNNRNTTGFGAWTPPQHSQKSNLNCTPNTPVTFDFLNPGSHTNNSNAGSPNPFDFTAAAAALAAAHARDVLSSSNSAAPCPQFQGIPSGIMQNATMWSDAEKNAFRSMVDVMYSMSFDTSSDRGNCSSEPHGGNDKTRKGLSRDNLSRMAAAGANAAGANVGSSASGVLSGRGNSPFQPILNTIFGSANTSNSSILGRGSSNVPGTNPPPLAGWLPGAAAAATAADLQGRVLPPNLLREMYGPGSVISAAETAEWMMEEHFYDDLDDDNEDDDDDLERDEDYNESDDEEDYDEDDSSMPELEELEKQRNVYHDCHPSNLGYSGQKGVGVKPASQVRGVTIDAACKGSRAANAKGFSYTPVLATSANNTSNSKILSDRYEFAVTTAAELLAEEDDEDGHYEEDKDDEEERAKRAIKKREKKNRKKEKAKKEAAIKAAQAAQKRWEKTVMSWRSRVVTACKSGDLCKIETLISESPFHKNNGSRYYHEARTMDSEMLGELENFTSAEEEMAMNMEWLLPTCIAKTRISTSVGCNGDNNLNNETGDGGGEDAEARARIKLTKYVLNQAFHVVFFPDRNNRTALHAASFVGDVNFVKLVVNQKRQVENGARDGDDNIGDDSATHAAVDKNGDEEWTVLPKHCLDILCDDSGWSPLHYAAACGWSDVVEVLLAGGCNVHATTEPVLTCRSSNGKGVTALELAEIILSETFTSNLECIGDALQDITDSRKHSPDEERNSRNSSYDVVIRRLKEVERCGYVPLNASALPAKVDKSSKNEELSEKGHKKSNAADDANSKKKKKKKKKGQPAVETKDESNSHTLNVPSDDRDPLVTALLGMGFCEDQINSAVSACGGFDRATADDLVVWILENESSGDTEKGAPPSQSLIDTAAPRSEDTDGRSYQVAAAAPTIQQHKQKAAAQTQKEAMETAARRDAEAKAAADRLAAKREEQRRIRREWNNREQMRQKIAEEAKLAEEAERRRRVEMDKVQAEAQKAALEQAASQTIAPSAGAPAEPPAPTSKPPFSTALCPATVNVGSTPLFPTSQSTPYAPIGFSSLGFSAQYMSPPLDVLTLSENRRDHVIGLSLNPIQQPQMVNILPLTQVDGSLDLKCISAASPVPQNLPTNSDDFTNKGTSTGPVYIPNVAQLAQLRSGKKMSKKLPKASLEVNPFDFPELGKEKEHTPPACIKNVRLKLQNSAEVEFETPNEYVKLKRNRGKQRQNKQKSGPATPKVNRSKGPSPALSPPGLHSNSYTATTPQSICHIIAPPNPSSYEANPLGEIRATAREFVPTNFIPKSAASKTVIDGATSTTAPSMSSQAVPPGLDGPTHSTHNTYLSHFSVSQDKSSGLNHSVDLASLGSAPPPHNSTLMSSSSNSLILNAAIDRPASVSPAGHSPIPSSASSFTGYSAPTLEDHNMSCFASGIGFDTRQSGSGTRTPLFLESFSMRSNSGALLGSIKGSTISSSSLAASSIWGGGASLMPNGLGGYAAFSFGDGSGLEEDTGRNSVGEGADFVSKNTANDNATRRGKSDTDVDDTWGFGSKAVSSGGKSIW